MVITDECLVYSTMFYAPRVDGRAAVYNSIMLPQPSLPYRRRRLTAMMTIAVLVVAGIGYDIVRSRPPLPVINGATTSLAPPQIKQEVAADPDSMLAGNILETIPVKGRAPKTGYKRSQFGNGWADQTVNGSNCDMRNVILARDLSNEVLAAPDDCTVLSGTLEYDPYTGRTIQFVRGPNTSSVIQIEHIVALSDAWQKGAQQLTAERRKQLANDPLELIAVDGPTNNDKGDADAASWLPPNKDYRCKYIARQIAVKKKYELWVTSAERDAMRRVLASCPTQAIPTEGIDSAN